MGGRPLEEPIRVVKVTIDEHFDGITTLVSPSNDEEHQIDVLAVSGLGSHAFGSFVHKEDGNMWLTDSLPQDIPTARVMIYGYKSGLQHSTGLVQLDDLAKPLQMAISQLLEQRKPLLLIGHSLGGLLIKEALIQIGEAGFELGLLDSIPGILLFDAPNDGMEIESLVPMVNDQPNRFLLESLNALNSQILRLQRREFSKVLIRSKCQLYCFYETELSPTAAKVDMPFHARGDSTKAIAGSRNRTIQDERPKPMPRKPIFCNQLSTRWCLSESFYTNQSDTFGPDKICIP